ncbi:MAG: hypothetical protein QM741_12910 [Rudaea sp.]|uniref:hypothetical protein n=1 Tax=Rudaea sp. TaxID=2136325 RepID=UPI0039E3C1DF
MPMHATKTSIPQATATGARIRPAWRKNPCLSLLRALTGLLMLLAATPLFAKADPLVVMSIAPAATPQIYGVQPTFYVRIYAASNADPVPTGTFSIAFLDDDAHYHYACLHSPIDTNQAVQTCTYADGYRPPVYSYHYVVLYSGDSNYNGDDHTEWTSVDYPVIPASPTVAMSDIPPVFVGQYFVALGLSFSQGYAPTGTVSLEPVGSGNDYCASTLSGFGYTPCISSEKMGNAGVFTLRLNYTGDANHNPYTNDNAGTLTVFPAPTALSVTLGTDSGSIALGNSVDVLVSVASLIDANARTSGTITVSDGEVSCSFAVYSPYPGQNSGYCPLTPVSAGTRTITAKFVNAATDPDFAASEASATLVVDAVGTDGVCGSDDGKVLAAAPTNLCSAGTASAVTGSGHPWNWSCTGSDGGATASCSANIQTWGVTTQITGGGQADPAQQLVDVGKTASLTLIPDPGYAIASATGCGGSLSGNVYTTAAVTADCVVAITFSAAAVNGTCGSDNGQTLISTPTHLCSAGLASAVVGSGPWTWTCAGINDGSTASCSAQKATTATAQVASAPALGLRALALLAALLVLAGKRRRRR